MTEKTLWNEFTLARNNRDAGGGILYCLRYDKDRIKSHQEVVVNSLMSMDVNIDVLEDKLAINIPKEFGESEKRKVYFLAEELSCLNEALEYSEVGFNKFNNVGQLCNGLMSFYFNTLQEGNLVDAYELVNLGIPRVINDLRLADFQNNALSRSERKELRELVSFVKRQNDILNSSGKYVLSGLNN